MDASAFSTGTVAVHVPSYFVSDTTSHFGLLDLISRGEYHTAMVSLLLMRESIPYYVL